MKSLVNLQISFTMEHSDKLSTEAIMQQAISWKINCKNPDVVITQECYDWDIEE